MGGRNGFLLITDIRSDKQLDKVYRLDEELPYHSGTTRTDRYSWKEHSSGRAWKCSGIHGHIEIANTIVSHGSYTAPILTHFLFIHAEATRLLEQNAPKLHVRLDYVQRLHREVLHIPVQSSRTLS